MESLLSLRLSLRFSATGLALGLMQPEPLETPAGLDAPSAAVEEPEQAAPSMLTLFSTFTRTVSKLRAEGGGRSPKSFGKKTLMIFYWYMT